MDRFKIRRLRLIEIEFKCLGLEKLRFKCLHTQDTQHVSKGKDSSSARARLLLNLSIAQSVAFNDDGTAG